MGENSAIEWTDHTFNPWWGCTRVSEACRNCYAESFARRFGIEWGPGVDRRFFGDKHWDEPRKWDRAAAKAGKRHRVFCASMADVFEYRSDLDEHRTRLWNLIADTPNIDWLLLTKRPELVRELVPYYWIWAGWPANVWIGTSVEDQAAADERIPHLLSIPAPVRFLSCEPLLGPVDLMRIDAGSLGPEWRGLTMDAFHGGCKTKTPWGVSWVIAGGESGPHARPSHVDWFRSLRDQCAAAGVPFFFKQWGEWIPEEQMDDETWSQLEAAGHDMYSGREYRMRVGKKVAGRQLDERTHDEFPEV